MNPDGSKNSPPKVKRSAHLALVSLLAALFLAGAAVSYVGIRNQPLSSADVAPATVTPADPVVRIDLPHEEFALPQGPHREQFQVNCVICHSTRLVFTQPLLLEKKWQEVVHKMVAVYGAPLGPDEELEIVKYLSAVHGQTAP